MNKHEDLEFLNSEATAASIKDAGLLRPTAFRHGPGHQAALQGIQATARPVPLGGASSEPFDRLRTGLLKRGSAPKQRGTPATGALYVPAC